MSPPRIYWRRAHPVRIPSRLDTDPHVELAAARQKDLLNADIQEWLAHELERELEART
jgi:hypothetical protein